MIDAEDYQSKNGKSLPLNVYFRSDWKNYVTSEMIKNIDVYPYFKTRFAANWDELGSCLDENPSTISCHINMIIESGVTTQEFVSMINTMIKMTHSNLILPIGVGIEKDTSLLIIKDLQKSGINGIIPSATGFGTEETRLGLMELINHRPYWPKHIISQLPNPNKKIKVNVHGIKLTSRQEEVLDLVCKRGLSNKGVAKILSISESTVKIHVSAIMRAYGVRNRTQLALSASNRPRI
jgi:DNA-binding NarL/FixJ family response regulator